MEKKNTEKIISKIWTSSADEIAEFAAEYIAGKNLIPPISMEELEIHTDRLMKIRNLPPEIKKHVSIIMNNTLWKATVAAIPFERRILLLPQCLRDPDKCTAEMDEFGLLCKECGACHIGTFQKRAEQLGYIVLIAEGTSVVTKLLEGGKIDAVIGVSCINALEKAFSSITAHAIPGIAVPLLNDGCIRTEVAADTVLKAINLHSTETAAGEVDIDSIRERVQSWFEYNTLTACLLQGENKSLSETERIAIEWVLKSGKRWRPFLVASTFSALTEPGAELPESVIFPALAVEFFHKASLVHDDIEDSDDTRYGEITLHKQYGIPVALNIGDLLIGDGYRLIAASQLPAEAVVRMLSVVSECHRTLSAGQGAELIAVRDMTTPLSVGETLEIFRQKTSPAFEAALALGAICADADLHISGVLKKFSDAFGIAYQIKDDIDDFINVDDEPNHLRFRCSLLMATGYESASEKDKKILCAFLTGKETRCDKCMKIISAPDNMKKVQRLSEHYKNESVRSLAPLTSAPLKSFLRKIIAKI